MFRHQVIEQKGQPPYVKIGLKEWRGLLARLEALEDAADVRSFDQAKELGGEAIPGSVVAASLDGNAIKAFREWRGLTQVVLARRAGLTSVYLSMMETGRRAGSLKTLRAIAKVLRIDVDLILPRPTRR
ncbi:MAG: helix-turn-helix transcriptional regulator [Alphaproteobacteria bacterium]|nr:helix-turn-helix transcriptional regulator [Alphaproteobacteria bacterium]